MQQPLKKTLVKIWKGWLGSILFAILIATSFKSAIADWNVVPTGSMLPTIVEGDRIFINKLAYDLKIPYTTKHIATWDDPKRGDIVVFYSPADGTRLVKRVVGLPGEDLELRNNQLFINGKKLDYERFGMQEAGKFNPYVKKEQVGLLENLSTMEHPIMITPSQYAPRSFQKITVPENSYFMMGDNRDNSADSRFFGFVDRSRIVGKAKAIVISLNIHDKYKPRWNRFFTSLQ